MLKEFLEKKYWAMSLSKMEFNKRKSIENLLYLQTPFLPQSSSLQQRGWHILHEVDTIPLCPICSSPLKFQRTNQYSKYCSVKCSKNDMVALEKKLQTEYRNNGGIDNYKKKKADIFKRISREKYGVDNLMQSTEIKERIKKIRNGG